MFLFLHLTCHGGSWHPTFNSFKQSTDEMLSKDVLVPMDRGSVRLYVMAGARMLNLDMSIYL